MRYYRIKITDINTVWKAGTQQNSCKLQNDYGLEDHGRQCL